MNSNAIDHDARFSPAELFGMFNVECADNWSSPNCLSIPLLKVKVKKVKASKRMKHTCDHIKEGITDAAPGKSRVADLVKFYATYGDYEVSPFEV